MVARNGDVDDAAGGDVVREENGGELDLYPFKSACHEYWGSCAIVSRNGSPCFGFRQGVDAYEAVVLGQEHGDTGVYLADSQGDQHGVGSLSGGTVVDVDGEVVVRYGVRRTGVDPARSALSEARGGN